jgi:hypothetical protein
MDITETTNKCPRLVNTYISSFLIDYEAADQVETPFLDLSRPPDTLLAKIRLPQHVKLYRKTHPRTFVKYGFVSSS